MNESYMEYMVRKKRSSAYLWIIYLCIFFAMIFLLFGIMGLPILLLFFLIFATLAYFLKTRLIIEYEYLYLEKEITIDKVIGLRKRKNVAKIRMENVDLFAPLHSTQANDALVYAMGKEIDYSSGDAQTREKCYIILTGNGGKYIIEPNVDFVKMAQMAAPRKVFIN